MGEKRKPKEDNRKLVFEDIWDDVPTTSSAPTTHSTANTATDSFCSAASFEGSRPGWYFGTGLSGLGYYKDLNAKGADAQAKPPSKAVDGSASWHSAYSDNKKATVEAIESTIDAHKRCIAHRDRKESAKAATANAEAGSSEASTQAVGTDGGRQAFNPPPRRAGAADAEIGFKAPARTAPVAEPLVSELHEMD